MNWRFLYLMLYWILIVMARLTDEVLLTQAANDVPCGTPVIPAHINRIVGGSPVIPGSWPWMVMLGKSGYQKCGGSILNEKFVLSSAHCFDGARLDLTHWTVHVGKYHVTILDPTESTHPVEKIFLHPGYNNLTLLNDIVLLLLKDPIVYSDYVRPVCVPPSRQKVVPIGSICFTTGWGETRGTGDSSVLNQVGLPLLNDYWCSRPDWYASRFVSNSTFCAGYAAGVRDTCAVTNYVINRSAFYGPQGDSGGPYNCNKDGKWYVQGVTSWGYDCAQPHWPGIYTDVSKYEQWIRNTMAGAGYPLQD